LFYAGSLGSRDTGNTVIFGLFAGFASFRRILQAFIVKEGLLAGSPDEFLSAVDAGYFYVFKLSFFGI
jgi:hypothetical protein